MISPTISPRIILLVASIYKNSAFLNNDNDPASKLVTLLKAWNSLRKRKKKNEKNALASAAYLSSLSEDGANDLLKLSGRYNL